MRGATACRQVHQRAYGARGSIDLTEALNIVREAWDAYCDPEARRIDHVEEKSAEVSTNRVYCLHLDTGERIFAKVSSYGAFVHCRQDHQRLHAWHSALAKTRFSDFLAGVLCKEDEPFLHRDADAWVVLYQQAAPGETLPALLPEALIEALAREMAQLHRVCTELDPPLRPTFKTVGSDITLLRSNLEKRGWCEPRGIGPVSADYLREHCDAFLLGIDRGIYHQLQKIPVLIDWNIGNFSVMPGARGPRLFSRWDMDWFRIEPRLLDFYFFSRLVGAEGDREHFSYRPDTLVHPRFLRFLTAYHAEHPLAPGEIDFLREALRFFLLNYTVREAEHFFRPELGERLRRESMEQRLPELDMLDLSPLHEALR